MKNQYANTLTPLGERILVQLTQHATMSAGGLHIADTAAERPPTATVLRIGRGKPDSEQDWHRDLAPGDIILLPKFGGVQVGEDLLVLPMAEILMRLDGKGGAGLLGHNIMVRLRPRETMAGSIVLPEVATEAEEAGTVFGTGPNTPEEITLGSDVLVSKSQGTAHVHGGVEYIIMDSRRVRALLTR